jgi:hypothetical protein
MASGSWSVTAVGGARSELARLDEEEPEDIKRHRDAEVRKTFFEQSNGRPFAGRDGRESQ